MAAFFSDEDVDFGVVVELRALGHDVLRSSEVGRANRGIPDFEQLRYSAFVNRCMLTINGWNYIRLHRHNANHGGIVTFTKDRNFRAAAARIEAAIRPYPDLAGQLIRVVRPP